MIEALWRECSQESQADIIRLEKGELPAAEMPVERVRFLAERGIAVESAKKVKCSNRFIEKVASSRRTDVSIARALFETPDDFATNIRTVLDLRIAHIKDGDSELGRAARKVDQSPLEK